MKNEGPLIVTIAAGLLYIISTVFAPSGFANMQHVLDDWYTVCLLYTSRCV